MAKYLVTGGAGFIGSNIARYVLAKGHDVAVLDDLSTGHRRNLSDIIDRIEFIDGDIRDRQAVDKAVSGCDAVFHEAARPSVPRSIEDPVTCHDVNVNGTMVLLAAARAAGLKRIVFAGSSSAYGNQPESPKRESMAPEPISPYAASKIACEAYLCAYAAAYGMETLALRYFNVFGPGQDPKGAYAAVIPAWVSRILAGERPVVYGDGTQSRDFCYIDNVCEANWLAATCPGKMCDGSAINIACNRAVTLNQILAKLAELLGTDIDAQYAAPRAGDVKDSLADITRAKQIIGYEPKIFFDEGLTKAIGWYKENLG